MNKEARIEEFLLPYDHVLQSLVLQLREYFKNETRPNFELIANTYQSLNFGYSFSKKAWDSYCAIILYRRHLNISLPSGNLLDDPDGLLHGTGSRIRHLKITKFEDIKNPGIVRLVNQARDNAFALIEDKIMSDEEVQIIIKKSSDKKKSR